MNYSESFPVFDPFPDLQYGLSSRWHGSMNRQWVVDGVCIGEKNRYDFLRHRGVSVAMATYAPILMHGADVVTVTSGTMRPEVKGDGCITSYYYCLCITVADCAPLYAFDPETQTIGLAHSGRKGTQYNIAGNLVEAFRLAGSDLHNIRCAVGPSICFEHYPVSREAALPFLNDTLLRRFALPVMPGDMATHYKIDIPGAIQAQLLKAGIRREHINISGGCTYEMRDKLFSHRWDNAHPVKTMLAYIYLP